MNLHQSNCETVLKDMMMISPSCQPCKLEICSCFRQSHRPSRGVIVPELNMSIPNIYKHYRHHFHFIVRLDGTNWPSNKGMPWSIPGKLEAYDSMLEIPSSRKNGKKPEYCEEITYNYILLITFKNIMLVTLQGVTFDGILMVQVIRPIWHLLEATGL